MDQVVPWEKYLLGDERLLWTATPRASSMIFYMLTNIVVLAGISFLSWMGVDEGRSSSGPGKAYVIFWFSFMGAVGYFVLLLFYVTGFHRIAYGATNRRTLMFRSIGFSWVSRRNFDPGFVVQRGFLFESVRFGKVSWWGLSPTHLLGIDEESFSSLCVVMRGLYAESQPPFLHSTNP